ncbi:MAG: sugar ABC transporter substrate-binding protein [Faecousia sp.]
MVKKLVAAALCVVMILSLLAGCGSTGSAGNAATSAAPAETSAPADAPQTSGIEGKKVGYLVPDTSEDFLAWLTGGVKDLFTADGVIVDIMSASGSAATQIDQVENCYAAGYDLIIVMACDPTGIGDALQRAMDAGTKVMIASADTGVYDTSMLTDQFEDGRMMAELASDWIDATYPDAAAGSIEVAILGARTTPDMNKRTEGMLTLAEMNDKVTLVEATGDITLNADAQTAMENLYLNHPDIKCVLTYNTDGALGVNEWAMRTVSDPATFGVFSSNISDPALELIEMSARNESVLRAIVNFGSNDLVGDTYRLARKVLAGEPYEKDNFDPLSKITTENVADFR